MPFKSRRRPLVLEPNDQRDLERLATARTASVARAQRARILLAYAAGDSVSAIARQEKVTRPTVENCLAKAIAGGIALALDDLPRPGHPVTITDDAKAWVVQFACNKPTAYGYAAEIWTYSQLEQHIRTKADAAGYPCLREASRSTIHKILQEHPIHPQRLTYYLERRDPEFDTKMAQVLVVYREVQHENALEAANPDLAEVRQHADLSYDEKPGIQAISNIAPDLLPIPGQHATIARDYEYKRHGTLSLLAGIDLHNGHIIGLVRDKHRSKEFIEFLTKVDDNYPDDWNLRIILDNHSAHVSKETMQWLKDHPNRFTFVFTPKHASWLNLIEIFFSKMARSFLRGIRVKSKTELKNRIELFLDEVNASPVVFQWRYKLEEELV
jgi:transposase